MYKRQIELTRIIELIRVERRGRLPGLRPGTIKKHLQHKRSLPLIELMRIIELMSIIELIRIMELIRNIELLQIIELFRIIELVRIIELNRILELIRMELRGRLRELGPNDKKTP